MTEEGWGTKLQVEGFQNVGSRMVKGGGDRTGSRLCGMEHGESGEGNTGSRSRDEVSIEIA